jgi:hypothetical protein
MEILNNQKPIVVKALFALAIILSAYFLVKTFAEIKSYSLIGSGTTATNTMSFDGKGEVTASPDLATISFTLRDAEKDVKDAQTKVTTKESAVLAFLSTQGIDKKDIKTENYSSYPKYDSGIPCYSGVVSNIGMPCRPTNPTIIGYEVSEYMTVKIHDLTKVGDIVKGLGAVGVSDMNGPNYSIEKEDALKAEARKIAIDDAKAKAESLAKDLGISLVRIVNFSENGNYPMPMMYSKGVSVESASTAPSPSPDLPTGENKITSNVTITYEIR